MSSLFGSSPSIQQLAPAPTGSALNTGQDTSLATLIAALSSGGAIGGIPGGSSNVPPDYTGQVAAPLSGLQSLSLDQLTNALAPAGAAAAKSGGTQGTAQDTLTSIMRSTPQDFNPYFKANVEQPLTRTFEETTLPGIVSALGGSAGGPQSTAAITGVTNAANDFGNQLASARSGLAYKSAQDNITNKLQATGQVPAVTGVPFTALSTELSAGAVPQQTQQTADTNLAANYQQFINNLINLMNVRTTTQGNTVVQPGSPGVIPSIFSGGFGNAIGTAVGSFL